MKLIIDIPEEAYKACKELKIGSDDGIVGLCAVKSIANGTPFDSVIEDIKADLERYRAEQDKKDTFHFLRMKMCDDFAEIIDKHIGKENING